jgi:altronate dehydratase
MPEFTGFARANGTAGARDHILVLPSVVCATHVAARAAGRHPTVVHQHGCLHVGDDLVHTEAAFVGLATNPNVRAVVVVSLGCETLQGRLLRDTIATRGQTVELVEIQAAGGSEPAIDQLRDVIAELEQDTAAERGPIAARPLVGIDQTEGAAAAATVALLGETGIDTIVPEQLPGPPSHVELAARGAQIIISLCGPQDAPLGSPVCPVISVAFDAGMYSSLHKDFDIDAVDLTAAEAAAAIRDQLILTQNGQPTSAELRGSGELVLERLAVTM